MKRVYTTSEIMVGATKLKVRQILFNADGRAPKELATVTLAARNWLQATIPIRPSDAYEDKIAHLFRFFFHAEPVAENTTIVWSVLNLIRQGLERPFAVKISMSDPDTYGYVSGYPVAACKQRSGKIDHWDADEQVMRRQGEIHLYRDILGKTDHAAVTLIHEAGHRFANLDDFGDEGYFYDDFSDLDDYKLPWDKCMRNAASYASFVYFVANPAHAQTLINKKLLAQNQRRLVRGAYARVVPPTP